MVTAPSTAQKKVRSKSYLQISTLVIIAFCSAFFPRVLLLLKFPSIINLFHLGIVPIVCGFVLVKTRVKSRYQIETAWQLIAALLIFFSCNIASALNNGAGLINAVVNFLLLCEHFLLLLAIISLPLTPQKLIKLRAFIVFSSFGNMIFAYTQRYIFRLHLRSGLEDNIKGVFINQGAGHVIGASVALTFGVYYLFAAKSIPLGIRILVFLLSIQHVVMADAKQAILVFGIGTVFFVLAKLGNVVKAIQYITVSAILGAGFYWCTQNIPAFSAFNTWIRPEIYGPDGEATLLKSATFRIVPSFYDSWLDPLLGLGPGHTVGRLGGWMVWEYESLLGPLGSTTHQATIDIWTAVSNSWLGNQSSMFSPLFGWAGVWGDLGILGLGAFLSIWWVVWRRICLNDISKFLVLTVLSFGLIFSQMEEPGYMLYVISLVGIQWHECYLRARGVFPAELDHRLTKRPKSLKGWCRALLLLPN